jgi:hypothetical protein
MFCTCFNFTRFHESIWNWMWCFWNKNMSCVNVGSKLNVMLILVRSCDIELSHLWQRTICFGKSTWDMTTLLVAKGVRNPFRS